MATSRINAFARHARVVGVTSLAAVLLLTVPSAAHGAASYPSDSARPDLVGLLAGYSDYWTPDAARDFQGTVKNPAVLRHDDATAVWINGHATSAERLLALQDAEYQNSTGTAYDQSITVSTGLGSVLGAAYVRGRMTGALPLTTALVNSSTGTAGAYLSTGAAKAAYNHPRPFVPSDPGTAPVAGDPSACSPSTVNAATLQRTRAGTAWADAHSNLRILRVPSTTDRTHRFSAKDVPLGGGYGAICQGGSFPSGHATSAFEAGITLATLLPELGPELLARASESANDRIVLGVHYPLDVMGGRIAGEAALAARWSDARYRAGVLQPARAELIAYLQKATGHPLAWAIAHETPYSSNPYGGNAVPGGTAQIVTDRATAVSVYTERQTYGFTASGTRGLAACVPAGASNLLLTAFPALTDAQRTSVLAQTQTASGYPLDQTGANGSWQRLDLARAMAATVVVGTHGEVSVTG